MRPHLPPTAPRPITETLSREARLEWRLADPMAMEPLLWTLEGKATRENL